MKFPGLLILVAPCFLYGQSGHWEGAIKREGRSVLFTVDLDDNPDWRGSFVMPGQNAPALALSAVEIAPPSVKFEVPDLPGRPIFKGLLGEAGTSIKGTVAQASVVLAFEMLRIGEPHVQPIPKNTPLARAFVGDWAGALLSDREIGLILHLREDQPGLVGGTLDTADRRAQNLLLSAIVQTGSKLSFDVRLIGASYQGEITADEKKIIGAWTQNGIDLPLVWERQK